MSKVVDYIIEKLKEPSTWRGIVWLATAFGFAFDPEQKEAIAAFGMTLAGLISVFVEKGNPRTNEEITNIVKQEHEKTVEKIIKEKKNAKSKKSNESSSDSDFFGDSDGGDGGSD